jgi:DNA-binding transcriptional LysR family regulator
VTHPLAGRSSVAFGELREERFVTNPIVPDADPPERWLAEQIRHGLPGRVAVEAASIQEILTLVSAGRGVCLVPSTAAHRYPRDDVRYVEVTDADPAVVSIARAREPARPAVEVFIQVARETARTRMEP